MACHKTVTSVEDFKFLSSRKYPQFTVLSPRFQQRGICWVVLGLQGSSFSTDRATKNFWYCFLTIKLLSNFKPPWKWKRSTWRILDIIVLIQVFFSPSVWSAFVDVVFNFTQKKRNKNDILDMISEMTKTWQNFQVREFFTRNKWQLEF